MKERLLQIFHEIYGIADGVSFYFAPGRVNLIGEHTDYNGGHVFPCALTLGTYAAVRKREDRVIRFYSENMQDTGIIETSLDNITYEEAAGWTNYPKGVFRTFQLNGYMLPFGMDIVVYGDLPNGSGLSSSASIEVLTGLIIKKIYEFDDVTMIDIAKIGQYSENNFNGMNCGIMDQFASAMGKKDHAIFLDTNTMAYSYASVKADNLKIVITNSKVKHSLVDSAYNDRRRECEEALKSLQSKLKVNSLGELTEAMFEANRELIASPVCQKRAKHAVYENQRTIQAVAALAENDLVAFGKLMDASHISLRDDYEVSCPEIDALAAYAWEIPGVLGSRMTGGGFGGCTVSLVEENAVDNFISTVTEKYEQAFGIKAECYVVKAGDGAHVL